MTTVRVFVSSPGDVGEERRLAQRALERLQHEFAIRVTLEATFWEHEPLRFTEAFQAQLPLPSRSDIFVAILWSRIGTRLPGDITRPDGTRYASGTEFEFEDAIRSYRGRGVPDMLVYRKTAQPLAVIDDTVLERLAQKRALDAFIETWFHEPDGSFTAAFHPFEAPAEFEELLETHLRKLIEARLPRGVAETAPPPSSWGSGSPFRGLAAFDTEHAAIFCGRTGAISDVLNALRKQATEGRPFVMVLGMSGVGKSSLVRAGVIPALTTPSVIEGIGVWRRLVLLPSDASTGDGKDLFDALARALMRDGALPELGEGATVDEVASLLRETPKAAVPIVRSSLARIAADVQREERLARPPAVRVALVVDQFEELFTLPWVTPAVRTGFVAALSALVRSGHVWGLATLRSDFYSRCTDLPELLSLKEGAGQYDLQPPTAAEIGLMIRQPARMAGLRFEEARDTGERLDDLLRDAAMHEAGALPLLEFTLEEIYKRAEGGLLTLSAYRALGGIEGAVASRAEEVLLALTPGEQACLPAVLRALVAVGIGEEAPVARMRAPVATVAREPAAQALLDAFVRNRLFVVHRGDDGMPVVSLAHEALVHHWPRLRQWLENDRKFLRARARIAAAEALWGEAGEASAFLLPEGEALDQARELLTEAGHGVTPTELRFVQASLEHSRRRRRRRRGLASLGVGLALAALAVAVWYWQAYLVIRIEHHADVQRRWGVMEGIAPLSDTAVVRRAQSYRIQRRGRAGVVEKVEIVDAEGKCARVRLTTTLATYLGDRPVLEDAGGDCAYLFERDASGRLLRETALDRNGKILYELQYTSDTTAYYKDRHGYARARTGSGAAYVEFHRPTEGPDRGRDVEVRYFDAARRPQVNHEGVFGVRQRFDARGLAVEEGFTFGTDGRPMMSNLGVAAMKLTADAHGRPTAAALFDAAGRPTEAGFCGCARVEFAYDEAGNRTERAFFSGDGRAVVGSDGVAREKVKYDQRGWPIEIAGFGIGGAPVRLKDGFAVARVARDDRTRTVELIFLDDRDKPTWHRDGFAPGRGPPTTRAATRSTKRTST